MLFPGVYGSHEGCQPYEIKPCEHHAKGPRGPCEEGGTTPNCHRQCDNNGYRVPYDQDKTFGSSSYSIDSDQEEIKVTK